MMPAPTFMVIGCRKCGTTNLCRLLDAHPDVFMTDPKEPQYYSRLRNFDQYRDWYASLFAAGESYGARGEGSTTYTFPRDIDLAARRIHEAIPDCRLIYAVRHPIRRLESDWKSRLRDGHTSTSINEATRANDDLVTLALYWKHLNVYRRLFSDDQILVVFLEDVARNSTAVLRQAFAHIGVSPDFEPGDLDRRSERPGRKVDNRLGAWARRFPGFDLLKRRLPQPVVDAAQGILTNERQDVAHWDPDILREVREVYRPDTQMLLEHCGKPQDYWDLDR